MTLVGQVRWWQGMRPVNVLEEWPDGMCVVAGVGYRGWVHKRELAVHRRPPARGGLADLARR